MSRQSARPALSDNGRFMDMWNTYNHCYQSENLEAMRGDAQRLSRAVGAINAPGDQIPPATEEPPPAGEPSRLSVDPAAMAASCTLHAGQVAQETGHPFVAQEMFRMILANFPEPSYRYYTARARRGLERLGTASRAIFSSHTM